YQGRRVCVSHSGTAKTGCSNQADTRAAASRQGRAGSGPETVIRHRGQSGQGCREGGGRPAKVASEVGSQAEGGRHTPPWFKRTTSKKGTNHGHAQRVQRVRNAR